MEGLNDMEKTVIEQKTEELLKQVNYTDGEVDVIAVAKSLGFVVGNAVLEDDMDGFVIVQAGKNEILKIKTDKLIGVNSSRDLGFKRFIIAHEIAHYILHYSSESVNGMYAHRDHRKGRSDKENDADYFAANLLMPKDAFKKKYNELKDKELQLNDMLLLLASYFSVPLESAKRRIQEIGL